MPRHSPSSGRARSRWPREPAMKVSVIASHDPRPIAASLAARGHDVMCAGLTSTSSSTAAAGHGELVFVVIAGDGAGALAELLRVAVDLAQTIRGPALILDHPDSPAAHAGWIAQLMRLYTSHEIVVARRVPSRRGVD
jgi:hypothetical protein